MVLMNDLYSVKALEEEAPLSPNISDKIKLEYLQRNKECVLAQVAKVVRVVAQ